MNPQEFLDRLKESGAEVAAEGDRLRVDAPAGVLTPEIREELQARKPELLRSLRPEPDGGDAGAPYWLPVTILAFFLVAAALYMVWHEHRAQERSARMGRNPDWQDSLYANRPAW